MITYKNEGNQVFVFIDGKRVGEIRKVDGGWQYFAQGKKKYAGEIFSNLQDLIDSLEEE